MTTAMPATVRRYGAHDQLPVNVVPVSVWRARRRASASSTRPSDRTIDPPTP
jgi:hypothetical protein